MNILQRVLKAQLTKNLLGAAVGVMVAMVVYGAYHFSSSVLAALMPPTPHAAASVQTNTEGYQRFMERVKEARSR